MRKLILVLAVALTACSPSAKDRTADFPIVPEGLKDCKIYRLTPSDGGGSITVVRCPLSSTNTTYSSGKTNASTATIEAPTVAASAAGEVKIEAIIVNGQRFEVQK